MSLLQLNFTDWLAVAGVFIGLVGLLYALATNRQKKELEALNRELELRLKSVTIEDLKIFCDEAATYLGYWRPDVIYCSDIRGGFVGYFLQQAMRLQVPILIGHIFAKDNAVIDCNIDNHYKELVSPKYRLLLDSYIYKYKGKKVLLVDEIVVTGEAIQSIREELVNNGFTTGAIKSCVVAASTAAIHGGRGPDFYWRKVENIDIVFPWGRWT